MALTKIDDRGLKTPIDLLDNEQIRLGTGNDFIVFHDGNHTYLDNNTGHITATTSQFNINNFDNSENCATFVGDGAVNLFYDGTKRLETKSDGARFTGHLYCNDNEKLRLGTGHDLEIYHDGSHSLLKNSTGYLRLSTGGSGVTINNDDNSETMAAFVKDGAVELYYDNSKKLETTSAGATISGNVGIGTTSPDQKLKIEDSSDLAIHLLKTGSQDTLLKNTGQTELCAATGNSSGQRIAFKIGANTGSLSDIAKFTTNGLCFGSDTAGANALDDYEEGSWTPSYYPMSSALTHSYSLRTGSYVKIGRVCYWQFRMRLQSMSGNQNQGLALSGFPYNVDVNQPQASGAFYCEGWAGEQPNAVLYQGGTNRATMYYYKDEAYVASSCNDLLTNNSYIAGSGFFFVS